MIGHDHSPHHIAARCQANQTPPHLRPMQQHPKPTGPKRHKSLQSAVAIRSSHLLPLPRHLDLTLWETPPLIACSPYDQLCLLIQTPTQQAEWDESVPMAFRVWGPRQDRTTHPQPVVGRKLQRQILRLLKRHQDPSPTQTYRFRWTLALKNRRIDRDSLEDVRWR